LWNLQYQKSVIVADSLHAADVTHAVTAHAQALAYLFPTHTISAILTPADFNCNRPILTNLAPVLDIWLLEVDGVQIEIRAFLYPYGRLWCKLEP
jgi:hypothetical protein